MTQFSIRDVRILLFYIRDPSASLTSAISCNILSMDRPPVTTIYTI